MGVDYNNYLGPYVEIHTKEVDIEYTESRCKNGHKNHRGDKFCSTCGKEFSLDKTQKTERPNLYDLVEDDYEDELSQAIPDGYEGYNEREYIIAVPNSKGIKWKVEEEGVVVTDDVRPVPDDVGQRAIVKIMEDTYASVLDHLRKHESVTRVNIRFGFLEWHS